MIPICSLIISTYNTPDRLRRCLQSVAEQRVLPAEIIIADDGSGEDTRAVVIEMSNMSIVPIVHVWQPDDGFRLAQIRNKAILQASNEYIINIDGDVLLDKYFVHDHLYFARRERFLTGDRAFLTARSTQKYMDERNGFPSFYTASLKKRAHAIRCRRISEIYAAIHRPLEPWRYVVGCNMSFWRDDLLDINGYNEAFEGWGGEDFDIAVRLANAGIRQYFLHFYAVAYHLDHPESDRSSSAANDTLFRQSVEHRITRIEHGINNHFDE
ncbi:MAG: glycosyltransferase family 2 protein [Prevotellaceae bacterium]|jgi:glycosyltransferase involved in cell wall biosynthesis|nr:glycosyltransferase family 2 protein [Prevotellaceae bacterium]